MGGHRLGDGDEIEKLKFTIAKLRDMKFAHSAARRDPGAVWLQLAEFEENAAQAKAPSERDAAGKTC
jgi:hypothetical protein